MPGSAVRLSDLERAALTHIAAAPFEAHYDNGITHNGLRLIGASLALFSIKTVDALARKGWVSKRKRLPRFGEGTRVVYVYEITALGRSMLA